MKDSERIIHNDTERNNSQCSLKLECERADRPNPCKSQINEVDKSLSSSSNLNSEESTFLAEIAEFNPTNVCTSIPSLTMTNNQYCSPPINMKHHYETLSKQTDEIYPGSNLNDKELQRTDKKTVNILAVEKIVTCKFSEESLKSSDKFDLPRDGTTFYSSKIDQNALFYNQTQNNRDFNQLSELNQSQTVKKTDIQIFHNPASLTYEKLNQCVNIVSVDKENDQAITTSINPSENVNLSRPYPFKAIQWDILEKRIENLKRVLKKYDFLANNSELLNSMSLEDKEEKIFLKKMLAMVIAVNKFLKKEMINHANLNHTNVDVTSKETLPGYLDALTEALRLKLNCK